jgi:hypothetical protein
MAPSPALMMARAPAGRFTAVESNRYDIDAAAMKAIITPVYGTTCLRVYGMDQTPRTTVRYRYRPEAGGSEAPTHWQRKLPSSPSTSAYETRRCCFAPSA